MASLSSHSSISSYKSVNEDPTEPSNTHIRERDDRDQLIHQGWKMCRLLAGSGVAASSGNPFFFSFFFLIILAHLLFTSTTMIQRSK
jgi:hypothetical protein